MNGDEDRLTNAAGAGGDITSCRKSRNDTRVDSEADRAVSLWDRHTRRNVKDRGIISRQAYGRAACRRRHHEANAAPRWISADYILSRWPDCEQGRLARRGIDFQDARPR